MSFPLALSITPETMMLTAAFVATSFSASLLGGIIGAGGGLLGIPLMHMLFMQLGLDSSTAMLMTVGTSSFAMIFASLLSTWREQARGLVEWEPMKRLIIPVVSGVVLAKLTGLTDNGDAMKFVFAALVSLLAIYMMFGHERKVFEGVPYGAGWSAFGVGFGVITSLTGLGGAVLLIPVLVACGIPLKRACTSCCILGVIVGVPSAIVYFNAPQIDVPMTVGAVNIMAAVIMVVTSQFGRPVGLWLQRRIPNGVLHKLFVGMLLLTATRLCWLTLAA